MAPKRAQAEAQAEEPKKSKNGLAVGDPLPDFELETEDSTADDKKTITAKDLVKDKGAVLFFYPKASTPGCTTQACGFRDNYEAYTKAGYAVYGFSADKPAAQQKWKTKENLQFHLISDPEKSVLKQLGVLKGDSVQRSHIVLDSEGKVQDLQIGVSPKDSIARAAELVLGAKPAEAKKKADKAEAKAAKEAEKEAAKEVEKEAEKADEESEEEEEEAEKEEELGPKASRKGRAPAAAPPAPKKSKEEIAKEKAEAKAKKDAEKAAKEAEKAAKQKEKEEAKEQKAREKAEAKEKKEKEKAEAKEKKAQEKAAAAAEKKARTNKKKKVSDDEGGDDEAADEEEEEEAKPAAKKAKAA